MRARRPGRAPRALRSEAPAGCSRQPLRLTHGDVARPPLAAASHRRSSSPKRSVGATAALSGSHRAEDAWWRWPGRSFTPAGCLFGAECRAGHRNQCRLDHIAGVHRQDEGVPRTPWLPQEQSAGSRTVRWTQKAPRLSAAASPRRAWGSRGHTGTRPWLGVTIWGHRRCVWARRQRAAASGVKDTDRSQARPPHG